MRYIPLSHTKRGFVGAEWNAKYLRSLQRMLIPTQGKGVSSRSFFEADFGKTAEEFVMSLAMPEEHLGWRGHFVEKKNEPEEETKIRREIWENNQKYINEWKNLYMQLGDTREDFIRLIDENNYTPEKFVNIRNDIHKKLFIHYFTIPTLLKALAVLDDESRNFVVDYITMEFPLMYERMADYVAESRIAYSMLEGPYKWLKAKFVISIFDRIDYLSQEEPFVINNLMKIQKKTGIHTFDFNLIRGFYLYKSAGVLNANERKQIIATIKKLDEGRTRKALKDKFGIFKQNLVEQASCNEVGAEYIKEQLEKQIDEIGKQLSVKG